MLILADSFVFYNLLVIESSKVIFIILHTVKFAIIKVDETK